MCFRLRNSEASGFKAVALTSPSLLWWEKDSRTWHRGKQSKIVIEFSRPSQWEKKEKENSIFNSDSSSCEGPLYMLRYSRQKTKEQIGVKQGSKQERGGLEIANYFFRKGITSTFCFSQKHAEMPEVVLTTEASDFGIKKLIFLWVSWRAGMRRRLSSHRRSWVRQSWMR